MFRSERHDASGIDLVVSHVIMALDVVEIHGVGDSIILIEIFEITEEVRVIGNAANVAFEVPMIDGVEADQCDEQPPIGLYDPGAE